jgi:anthranilate phosphoribosyltransferase
MRRDGTADRLTNDPSSARPPLAGFFVSGALMNQISTITRPSQFVPDLQPAQAAEIAVARLLGGEDLSRDEASALFLEIVEGRLPEPLISAAFVALRLKGETAEELAGAALALRSAARSFERPDYLFADSCGTGGDCSGSINVSTAAGFVAAACGLPIVKHGNRSFTSKCGSADVLEALGARLDASPETSRQVLDETGFCFLLAPQYHPGIAHAGPVRRALKVRTIMNLLGPCLNPGRPPVQLLGVAEGKLLEPIAQTLRALGVERALVVHGSGLDEIALHGFTEAVRLADGELERIEITPEQAGLDRQPLQEIAGGSPADNADRLRSLLEGRGRQADRDIVAVNAGALLATAGRGSDVREATQMAAEAIGSGAALRVLDRFIEASNG